MPQSGRAATSDLRPREACLSREPTKVSRPSRSCLALTSHAASVAVGVGNHRRGFLWMWTGFSFFSFFSHCFRLEPAEMWEPWVSGSRPSGLGPLVTITNHYKPGGLKQQKRILSQFWRLQVPNQVVSQATFTLKALGNQTSLPLHIF